MRLEWIEDILAVLDTGSFANAANVRNLTQSAFTRRIRTIEHHIGARLFDRSKKPAELLPHVGAQEQTMRSLVLTLRELRTEFSEVGDTSPLRVSFACQHSLATTISPTLIKKVVQGRDVRIRVTSANRDACLMMLLSGEADFAIIFGTTADELLSASPTFTEVTLQSETLLPVASEEFVSETKPHWEHEGIPIIGYPADVFLGQQIRSWIYPEIHKNFQTHSVVETALTLAAVQYAVAGLGVTWIPATIAEEYLQSKRLMNLESELPSLDLRVTLTKLSTGGTESINGVWAKLEGHNAPTP